VRLLELSPVNKPFWLQPDKDGAFALGDMAIPFYYRYPSIPLLDSIGDCPKRLPIVCMLVDYPPIIASKERISLD
jgi:hypothetical protein